MPKKSRVPLRFWFFLALLLLALPTPSVAAPQIWSVLIPDAFPGIIYTWHFQEDGTYSEDGRDARSGQTVQATMHGRWRRDGAHMTVQQDGFSYVFEGTVAGSFYAGTLYSQGRNISRFCAVKGAQPSRFCDSKLTS